MYRYSKGWTIHTGILNSLHYRNRGRLQLPATLGSNKIRFPGPYKCFLQSRVGTRKSQEVSELVGCTEGAVWHYVTRWPDGIFNIACTVDSIVQQECGLGPICQVMLLKAEQTWESSFLIHNLTFLEHISIPVLAWSVNTEPSVLEHISSGPGCVLCYRLYVWSCVFTPKWERMELVKDKDTVLALRSSHSKVGRNQEFWQKVGRSVWVSKWSQMCCGFRRQKLPFKEQRAKN